MKTIGIKLADGSFYPVLEDNTASEKSLTLTTAHNNQTKVMVDLYRSPTCSMEDAEYVDSLQIENLNAHPNGVANISFTISLDENNQLSARIIDQETGNQSNTTISLVSRTLEERLVTDQYDISDKEDKKIKGFAAAGGLLAAAEALSSQKNKNEENDIDIKTEMEEPVFEEASVDIPVKTKTEQDSNDISEEQTEEPVDLLIDETQPIVDIDSDDISDFEIPDENDTIEKQTEQDSVEKTSDDTQISEIPDDVFGENKTEETSEDLSDFNFDDLDLPEPESEKTEESVDITMDEPEKEDSEKTIDSTEETEVEMPEQTEESLDDSLDSSLDFSEDATLEMPTDKEDFFDSTTEETADKTEEFDDDLSTTSEDFSFDDIPSESEDNFFDMEDKNMEKTNKTPEHNGIDFDGLYDSRTVYPEKENNTDEDIKKKTKAPVIICIICAIICLIATALILFIIPSKYNLLSTKTKSEQNRIEHTLPAPIVEQPKAEEPATNQIPEQVPEAKEDEIVVVEKAENVVPSQPPAAESKPKNITYKIKWGDTLWDIANTYYKNPWRYKRIARFNGIKNPDYIISGTFIIIPAE